MMVSIHFYVPRQPVAHTSSPEDAIMFTYYTSSVILYDWPGWTHDSQVYKNIMYIEKNKRMHNVRTYIPYLDFFSLIINYPDVPWTP